MKDNTSTMGPNSNPNSNTIKPLIIYKKMQHTIIGNKIQVNYSLTKTSNGIEKFHNFSMIHMSLMLYIHKVSQTRSLEEPVTRNKHPHHKGH